MKSAIAELSLMNFRKNFLKKKSNSFWKTADLIQNKYNFRFTFFNSTNIIDESNVQENEKKLIDLDSIIIFLSARETQNEATGIRFRRYNHTIVKITRVHRLV